MCRVRRRQHVKNSLTTALTVGILGAMTPGRPRRPNTPDKAADALVRNALNELAASVRAHARQRRHPTGGSDHLLLAVNAARIAAAADRMAHAHVALARETDGVTWEQIGDAFGTTRQSAHERFRIPDSGRRP